ncbi:putative thioesterase (yiiD_Cterm) [compost metagenome]
MPKHLAELLKDRIKLYEHLGLEVVELTSLSVRFRVSLEENLNHKGTAFGGSIYAAAVLSAYALVLHGLRERKIATDNIVIQKGEIQYLKPVESDFEVLCQFPSKESADNFYARLTQDARAKEVLTVKVQVAGDTKAILKGTFVVRM